MTFAQLPGSPRTRDSYDITDSKTATPGVIEVGGGSLLCTVYWNGQYWIDSPANYPYVPSSPIQPNTGLLQYTVAQLPSYSQVVLSDTPGGYWRCGEASGNLADSSGNANTATMTGTTTYAVAGSVVDDVNTAVTPTINSKGAVAANASLPSGDTFTIEFAFKRGTLGTSQYVVTNINTPNGLAIAFAANNTLVGIIQAAGSFVTTVGTFTDNNWHLAQVWKSGAASGIYIDGVAQSVTQLVLTHAPSTTAMTILNLNSANLGFLGSLDEIAVYTTVLSATRVAAHYSQWIAKKNGSMAYATDGTPASNPVTGSGAGVTVTYTQGKWAAVL